ncbi:unnamed protein product [Rotaria sordida]|uniref:Uncharacterized protein n=1 Tax=Rotaria sordida TaxID=392033 RepID=A0A814M7T7_9BILA|nr:unnamed protein product [Rotaria sordida]CAF1129548.1 unnamed protein product [Rotaria sordida]CAF4007508.1 unnamed protein product [Rotaria sordida]CAF4058357.1 unnamed protein product [Rotaria sordida]
MHRWYQRYTKTDILAIGIEGDRSSLCGAIKRFQRYGIQSNGLLTLKEQCARYIVLIKNEQIKWFITVSLPVHLFKYVTKDIFNLQRDEFTSNNTDNFDLCEECSMNINKKRRIKCQCPKLERAIDKLNKYFFKRMNNDNKITTFNSKKFELIYKLPNSNDDYWDYYEESPLFFLYLLPCAYHEESNREDLDDMDCGPYHTCRLIDQVSVEDKLLFVDVMRFFGGFQSKHEQPKLILYHCHEHQL